jgi:hypothetical protein
MQSARPNDSAWEGEVKGDSASWAFRPESRNSFLHAFDFTLPLRAAQATLRPTPDGVELQCEWRFGRDGDRKMPRERNKSLRIRPVSASGFCIWRLHAGENIAKRIGASVIAGGIVLGLTARGDERESLAAAVNPQQSSPQAYSNTGVSSTSATEPETAAVRAETNERLKGLGAAPTPDATQAASESPTTKTDAPARSAGLSGMARDLAVVQPLQKLLENRLLMLDEHSKLVLALKKATIPQISPEHQADQLQTELAQIQAMLKQSDEHAETLLPVSFHKTAATPRTALVSEMKDAIDATTHELGQWKSKIETLRSGRAERENKNKAHAAERDKVFKLVTSLTAKNVEYEKAAVAAGSSADGRLAQETLVNHQWEVRVEAKRLQVIEAQIALEAKLAGFRELEGRLYHAHIQLAERSLAQMRLRFRAETEEQESDLIRDAADEKNKAQSSDDPLERFRARRMAELLDLEAQVLKNEQALATNPSPSFEEQQTLADHADKDFAQIRELLDDGEVSRLDALRLTNEFRRIAPERERLVRNEMATVEARLQFFEKALTDVEIELFQDSLHDRLERDLLKERVSAERWTAAETLLLGLERKHREILIRRQKALENLAERSSHTLQQIARRLTILDQEYGFIRTQIFWVRDQDPIAAGTFLQGAREFNYLLKDLLNLIEETMKPALWARPSAEFMATGLAVLVLPVAVVKLRRALGGLIRRKTGDATG